MVIHKFVIYEIRPTIMMQKLKAIPTIAFIILSPIYWVSFCYTSKRIMTFFAIKKATSPTIAEFPLLHHAEKVYFPHYRVVYLQSEYRNSHFPTPPQRHYIVSHHDGSSDCDLPSTQREDLLSRRGNPTQGNIFLSYMEKHYINYFTGDLSRSFSSNDFIYSYYISGYSFLLETTVIFYSGTSDYGII